MAFEFGMNRVHQADGVSDGQADIVAALAEGAKQLVRLVAAKAGFGQPAQDIDLTLLHSI